MSHKLFQPIIFEKLIEDESENYMEIFILTIIGFFLFLLSALLMIFYAKKFVLIKTKPFIFILLHCLTNLVEIQVIQIDLFKFKTLFSFISYLFQFHLIISFINRMIEGKQIFKSDKDFSIKKLICFEIILSIITFPYAVFFQGTEFINFCQYLAIIIFLLCFYEYVKNKINQVIKYINECNKDNLEIAYLEQEELNKIYLVARYLWVISFILILIYYIAKFFDILLKKIENVHYIVSIALICAKESLSFILFLGLVLILYLLNKSYDKGQIIPADEDSANLKKGGNKLEIEIDDINIERNNKKNEENNIEKSEDKKEDNVIEIESMDIKNGKENKNEEEKLDEEDENLNINSIKETDKLK